MAIREKLILDAEDRASQAFDKASGSFGQLDGLLRKAAGVGGVAIAGRALLDLGVNATQIAIDAEEAASAFDTTFGPAVGQVSEFVDEFANKAGFADFQLQQMLATTGAVAQGIGATSDEAATLAEDMATLAGDVASFSNATGGAEAVLGALQSALTGEREALKTYGIAISEAEVVQRALTDSTAEHADELTRLERAQATIALAYEKAGVAVGDLDRTQDSAANTLRRLNALWIEAQGVLGEALLPVLEESLPTLESLIGAFGAFAETAGPELAAGLSVGVEAVDLLTATWLRAKATFAGGGIEGFQADAIADAAAVAMTLRNEWDQSIDTATLYANGLAELARRHSTTADAAEFLAQSLGVTRDEQILAMRVAGDWAAAHVENSNAASVFARRIAELEAELEAEALALGRSADAARLNARAAAVLADAHDDAVDPIAAEEAALAELRGELDRVRASQALYNTELLAAADPVFRAVDSFRNYQSALADVRSATDPTVDQILELAESQLEMESAFEQIDAHEYEAFVEALQSATGLAIDDIETLLSTLGEFDGRTFSATAELHFTEVGSFSGTGGGVLEGTGGPPPISVPDVDIATVGGSGGGGVQQGTGGVPSQNTQNLTVTFGDIIVQSNERGGVDEHDVARSVAAAIEAVMS